MADEMQRPQETVFVTLENYGDKLSQNLWCHLVLAIREMIHKHAFIMHGHWFTEPSDARQSACWGFQIFTDQGDVEKLRALLTREVGAWGLQRMGWVQTQGEWIEPPANTPVRF